MIVLKLTTPFDPGMYDAGASYPHVIVTNFNFNTIAQIIEIVWEYGTMDATKGWASGAASMPQRTILQNEDFFAAAAAMPTNGASDSILMAAARECYDILSSKAQTAGDVVDITATPEPTESATPTAKSKKKA